MDGEPVLCVHGLTRNGRDFDVLAVQLAAQGRRVICPDVFGRGFSDWLPDPKLYSVPVYAQAFAQLLAHLPKPFDWIGTSMGGLIGMAVAAMPECAPRRMVLNDIGPFLPARALQRIADYLTLKHDFASVEEVETHLRLVHASFGRLSDAEWRQMAVSSARLTPEGRWVLHYDPAIAAPASSGPVTDIDLWQGWGILRLPILVLRGAESDLLDEKTAKAMETRPQTRVVTFPDCGHAPALMTAEQTSIIVGFVNQNA